MTKFVFVLTRGLEDPTRVTRSFQLAKAAMDDGHDVKLFLTDDAVTLVREGMLDNVVAPTGDEAGAHYYALIQNKVPVYLCTPCAHSRQMKESEVDFPVQFAGAPKLFELSQGATVFTF